jgi:hypothetical protein
MVKRLCGNFFSISLGLTSPSFVTKFKESSTYSLIGRIFLRCQVCNSHPIHNKKLKFPVFASVAADVHSQEKRNSPANFASLMLPTTPLTRGGGGGGGERRSARVSSVFVSELGGECWAQGHSVRKLF